MTGWELEARGAEELRNQVQASLARQAERPKLDVQMARAGQPVPLVGMTAYVAQVEFADGKLWIPSRHAGRPETGACRGALARRAAVDGVVSQEGAERAGGRVEADSVSAARPRAILPPSPGLQPPCCHDTTKRSCARQAKGLNWKRRRGVAQPG